MRTYTIKPLEWRDKSNAEKTEFDAFNLFGYYAAYENSDKDGYLDSDYQYKAHTLRPHEFLTEEFSSQQEAKEWCEAQYEKHVAEYLVEVTK